MVLEKHRGKRNRITSVLKREKKILLVIQEKNSFKRNFERD
jgi:hypothetical protein